MYVCMSIVWCFLQTSDQLMSVNQQKEKNSIRIYHRLVRAYAISVQLKQPQQHGCHQKIKEKVP